MNPTAHPENPTRAAIEFVAPDAAGTLTLPAVLELLPHDALILWEDERTDQYKRVVGLIVGNKLKLVRLTVGRVNTMDVLCEAPLVDEPALLRTQFLTRDALILWATPREPRGLAKTLVLRVGQTLKMLRVNADETAPAIEVLQSLDAGG